jgi:hypothetical protein
VWSLAEINAISARAPLSEGQRLIVPRHLMPAAAPNLASAYAPVGR